MRAPDLSPLFAPALPRISPPLRRWTACMFTTFKVRANQPAGDYRDPGDYAQPAGTQAYEWQGAPAHTPRPARADTPGTVPGAATARKPAASSHQH